MKEDIVIGKMPRFRFEGANATIQLYDGLSYDQRVVIWDKKKIKELKEFLGIV